MNTLTLVSQYDRFMESINYWLPDSEIFALSLCDEEKEMERCFLNFETYKLRIKLENGKLVSIIALTRNGYFILNGKPYVWTWKEVYCPNWIYKHDKSVEVWSAPIDRPWDLYQGRLHLFIHKDTLCLEGYYQKGARSLLQCLEDYDLDDLDVFFDSNFNFEKYNRLLKGGYIDKKDSLKAHPFLPHLVNDKKSKSFFLSLMVRNFFDQRIPICNPNDVNIKRIVGVEWLVGHICGKIEDPKACTYMTRRIYSQGQLLDLSSYFETISHLSRVVRGIPTFGNFKKRELDDSHMGVYCPYRSSEGESIGLKVDLVTDVKIEMYKKNFINPQNEIINGDVKHVNDFDIISAESKYWVWTDGGRVKKGKVDSIGHVARQLIFCRHMPPVRSMYATTHIRQSMLLCSQQKPVILPKKTDDLIINGCNAIVAVCGYHGWNIEDAIVCSRTFIENGGLMSIQRQKVVVKKFKNEQWSGDLPEVGILLQKSNVCVSKINADGKDRSVRGKYGIVKKSYRIQNDSISIVELEFIHKLEMGDKLSTRSGQKGVIGHIAEDCDMPYTTSGIIPDIIINPAHLPSRMTVSQMLESYFGKESLINGNLVNDEFDADKIKNDSGKEEFICGMTGIMLKNPLFVGTVYYMALHHMVYKKCRSRNRGPINKLTGQPTKGGILNGGLRIGEMERDTIRARNAESVLRDRMRESSDLIKVLVCASCGWLEPNQNCCENSDIKIVKMSRSTRLVLMEMYGLGIFPRLHF